MLAGIQTLSPSGSSSVKHFTARLVAGSQVGVKVGQVLQIDVVPIEGRIPELQLVAFDDTGGGRAALRGNGMKNRYRAVAVGSVKLGVVSRQDEERCQRELCTDVFGVVYPVVSVNVTS